MGATLGTRGYDSGSYAVQQAIFNNQHEFLFHSMVLKGGDGAGVVNTKHRVAKTAPAWPLRVEGGLWPELEIELEIMTCSPAIFS